MPETPTPRARHAEIAKRMRQVRIAFGPSLSDFCRRYKFSVSQWSNYEAGFKPSLAVSEQLVTQIDGLSLDWIYRGKTGGMTLRIIEILNKAGENG